MWIVKYCGGAGSRARVLIISVLALAAGACDLRPAISAPRDYRFELVGAPVRSGNATLFKVRLIHVPDGRPVPSAIITETKLNMGPESMARTKGVTTMTAATRAMPSSEPGIYQIEADSPMDGNWRLDLAAMVQGEPEPVRGTLAVAVPK